MLFLTMPHSHLLTSTYCNLVFFFILQILTTALTTHVRTVGRVWMISIITPANAQQVIPVETVKRASLFLLFYLMLFFGSLSSVEGGRESLCPPFF